MAARSIAIVVVATALACWASRRRGARTARQVAARPAGAQPLVIVVGLGGVGSHAAHLLLRSGVRRLRLIDFDQVTLSSLNRHATATRLDVGTPKATALRAALLAIDPGAAIEARSALFCAEAADDLLSGGPALVVDAIDDIKTKAELQAHCVRAGLRVLSALGAGGKADCGAILVAPLADVLGDPVANGMAKHLKAEAAVEAEGEWWDCLEQRVECVYSSEKQRVGLLPIPEGVAHAAELGSQPTFRVRVLPVLPPVPAAFGAALASRALDLLGNAAAAAPPPPPLPPMASSYQRKLFLKFEKEHVLKQRAGSRKSNKAADKERAARGGEAGEVGEECDGAEERGSGQSAGPAVDVWLTPELWPVSFDDVGLLVTTVFHGRCAISGLRLQDPTRPQFCLCLLDERAPPTLRNVIFTTTGAADAHRQAGGLAGMAPRVRERIEAAFERALCGRSELGYVRARAAAA